MSSVMAVTARYPIVPRWYLKCKRTFTNCLVDLGGNYKKIEDCVHIITPIKKMNGTNIYYSDLCSCIPMCMRGGFGLSLVTV